MIRFRQFVTSIAVVLFCIVPSTIALAIPSPPRLGVAVPASSDTELDSFEAASGQIPTIVMDYADWVHQPDFPSDFGDRVRARGATPMITWEPWDNTKGVSQPTYQLADIVQGNYDELIRRWAIEIKTWNHRAFLRFGQEMNGNWYPWSEQANGNKPGEYIAAWTHVHNIFNQVGVTNISWVWSPNISYTSSTPMSALYPGNNYVDWIGLDGYNWGPQNGHNWQTFGEIFDPSIAEISAVSPKPLMISEVSSNEAGGSKADWITDMFKQMYNTPRIRAFIWFNYDKENDWRIQSSPSASAAFAASAVNMFGNN